MLIAAIDIETTGLEFQTHRIIEYCGIYFSNKNFSITKQEVVRIDPERSISSESQRIHGISYSELIGKPKWPDVAKKIHSNISTCDLIIAHNGEEFDLPFLNSEFKRIGLDEIKIPVFDTMKQGRWATPEGKLPRLEELCFACGVSYDRAKAHSALYDVQVMIDCFKEGLETEFYKLK